MRASERSAWPGAGIYVGTGLCSGLVRALAACARILTRRGGAVRAAVCALLGALVCLAAQADERIAVSHAAIRVQHGADPGTFVDAQFELSLPASLREAVDHGIALYFAIELEVSRGRWYWFDKRLLDEAIEYRISFSPLTRQYRLARGGLAQPFDTLDQALATLRRVNQWRVADAALFDDSHTKAQIRLRLDTSMLPKPFQVSALTDRDWVLVSDWSGLSLVTDAGN